MQADGGFVQHIEDAGGAVADGPGQLHPLALTRREGGRGAVQRQVGQAQIHQPAGSVVERFADTLRHRPHRLRERSRYAFDPFDEFGERHLAGFGQVDSAQEGRSGGFRQPGSAAFRADILFQELLYALHAGFVLDLGHGVFHAVNGAVVGEVHLGKTVGLFVLVDDVTLFGRAVIDDFLFLRREVFEGDVGPDTHLAGDILHQRPHQRAPRGDGAFVDGQRLVRNQGGFIHGTDDPRAAAAAAGAFAVESQLFGAGRIDPLSADRAENRLFGSHVQRGLQVMAVGTSMAREAGKHQPQAVQQLGKGPERAPDARYAGALMQGQRRGHITHVICQGTRGLGHPAAGIRRKGLEIAAGPFRIQHPQGQGRFPGPGYPGNPDNLSERDIYVKILEVMGFRATDFYVLGHWVSLSCYRLQRYGFFAIICKVSGGPHCLFSAIRIFAPVVQ